jgi:ubiquinone/menaquinone biosynthesis C-methylase UbiE
MEYWKHRANQLGERAVFNVGHSEEELSAVTEMQKSVLYPRFREALDGSERTVLDFGCGTGRFTPDLAEMVGGTAIGLDPIQDLLDLAPRHEAVTYRTLRPEHIPLPDASMDAIWICIVLGGITNEDELRVTAAELERVRRPGGLLFLAENTSEKPPNPRWMFRSASQYAALFPAVRLEPVAEYEDLGERISVLAGRASSR